MSAQIIDLNRIKELEVDELIQRDDRGSTRAGNARGRGKGAGVQKGASKDSCQGLLKIYRMFLNGYAII